MNQDFDKKVAIVVRKDLEPWQIANTIAHIGAYMGNKLKESFGTGENFITKDNISHPRNSQYPIIIKRAKSREQLKNLMQKIRNSSVLYHGFIREMIEHESDSTLQKALDNKEDVDIEYLGIGVFGKKEGVDKLTKKFGLWN